MGLFKSVARAVVKYAGNAVGFGFAGEALLEVWDTWNKETPAPQEKLAEVEQVAQLSPSDTQALAEQIVQEVAGDQPESVRQTVTAVLTQLPGLTRRSLRRPADPTGMSLRIGQRMAGPDDLGPLLPPRLPRFKAGDTPVPGADLELVELLGVGGFGEVWKAADPSHDGVPAVALKFCTDAEAARTLRHEAGVLNEVMRRVHHPGIVRLQRSYLRAEPPFLEYEFVEGGDLAGVIREWHSSGTFSATEATRVLAELAEIVGFAHRLNPPIVHRDLKPANILVRREGGVLRLKVADFGIGGVATQQAVKDSAEKPTWQMTALSTGTYTPLYASPQQMKRQPPDPHDDVYALGVIWFQMLTANLNDGRPGGSFWRKKLAEQGMTAPLVELLESCFDDEPENRPNDAAELAERLATLMPRVPSATTATVVSSQNPSVYGQAVSFTATVNAVSTAAGTPTGTVTFMEGATVLEKATLSGGTAALTTVALSAGSHTITVNYSGDNDFLPGTSASLTQIVKPALLTVAANTASKIHGAPNPTFSETITGFVNGDTANVVSGRPSLTTTATDSSGVGNYTITAAQGSLSTVNYSFTFVDGTLTVIQQPEPQSGQVELAKPTMKPRTGKLLGLFPLTPFLWEDGDKLTDEHLLKLARVKKGTAVARESLNDFRHAVSAEDSEQFEKFIRVLQEQVCGVEVYKVGNDAEKQIFLVGKTPDGKWAGLKTERGQHRKREAVRANSHVVLETSKGTITIELEDDKAPITVANFLGYVDDQFYDNTIFHRVISTFMIQGGGFEPGMKQKKTKAAIQNESSNGLSNKRGTLAMAHTSDPHSATAQFFINVKNNKFLDKAQSQDGVGYCVFGRVVNGMDVVDAIKGVATTTHGQHEDVPATDVVIKSICRANHEEN